jgi:hypothetical protein
MTQIRCLSTGGYKLTEGKPYEVLQEEKGYYIIKNDNNKVQRYSSGFFEVIEEEVQLPPEPAPKKTENQLIQSIEIFDDQVSFIDFNNNRITINNNFGSGVRMDASCGIGDVTGLINMCNRINSKLQGEDYEDDDYLNLRKALLKACINQYILEKAENRAAYIVSTYIGSIDECYEQLLNELSNLTSEILNNPNSRRSIKFWTFYKQ